LDETRDMHDVVTPVPQATSRLVGDAIMWSVLAKGGRILLGLMSSILVVRGLGNHDYGVLSLVRTVLAFVAIIASAGLGQALLKFLPTLRVSGDRREAGLLTLRVLVVQIMAWGGLLCVAYFASQRFESLFEFEGVGRILWIGVALAVFELLFTLTANVLNAHYDTKLLSAASISLHLVFIGVLLILLSKGAGVLGVLVAAAAGNLVATLIVSRRVIKWVSAPRGPTSTATIERRRVLRFSLPFVLIGILNVIVWRQSETLFLAHFRGAVETGFFDLAYRIPQMVLEFVPGTVWPIIMAGFSQVYARDASRLGLVIDRYYRMLFVLCAPLCIIGITLSGRMIPILFGEAMAPAAMPAQLFFAIFTVSFFGTPLSMSLYVMEKSHVNLLIYLVLAAINVGLDIILIPRFGVVGALIPVGFVVCITPVIYKIVLRRFVEDAVIPYRFIGKCFLGSSPVLLLLPFGGLIRGVLELFAAAVVAGVLVVFSFKKVGVLGKAEMDLLGQIPFPPIQKLLKFISS
jgi:O-antigen/teichoic acid export membrane protein